MYHQESAFPVIDPSLLVAVRDHLNIKISNEIALIKIRRSHDRLIFVMEIIIHGLTVFILRRGPVVTLCWKRDANLAGSHYSDVIMSTMASQITSLTIVYSTVYSGSDQRKHQSSASLAFVRGIHRWPVNSPLKGPVMRKMFPFDDVIMCQKYSAPIATMGWFVHSNHVGHMFCLDRRNIFNDVYDDIEQHNDINWHIVNWILTNKLRWNFN